MSERVLAQYNFLRHRKFIVLHIEIALFVLDSGANAVCRVLSFETGPIVVASSFFAGYIPTQPALDTRTIANESAR